MKGKSSAEAKSELESSGMSADEVNKILPHKASALSLALCLNINKLINKVKVNISRLCVHYYSYMHLQLCILRLCVFA